jgi:outer membrane protein assembly factor BamB
LDLPWRDQNGIMKLKVPNALAALGMLLSGTLAFQTLDAAPVSGWLTWRGPSQNGSWTETGLPDQVDAENPLWTAPYPGASTPVIANGRLYIMGFVGEDPNLQEGIGCFDAETGKELWSHRFSDFLSDIIYKRYATSSPAIDPETGNVYMQGTQGILAAFTADGKLLWHHSMMEKLGRLTFPNGRTASPVIDGDLVITRGITANWGTQGPGGDRFYAFDKKTGELVWASLHAERPKDSCFSTPYLGWLEGRRVLYATTGDGNVICINARTGEPIWRMPIAKAGINASILVHNDDKVIAIYGTPYEPGQMVALRIPKVIPANPAQGYVVVERSEAELWSNDLSTSTSSPILFGDRVYVVSEKGDLCAVDAGTGEIVWRTKIGIEQRNSSPLYADGKLYVPMLEVLGAREAGVEAGTTGAFYVVDPKDGKILSQVTLDGRCFGSPTAYNGKVYVQTLNRIYAFGKKGNNPGVPTPPAPEKWPAPGAAAQLQIIPSEVLLHPGEAQSFRVRVLDANGFLIEELKDPKAVKWEGYIPATARVRASMKASFNEKGELVAATDPVPSAGMFKATKGELNGYIRGRVLPYLPLHENFDSFTLTETDPADEAKFAYPPLAWIGARFKFDVREKDGENVLAKTIDDKFFQRGTVFIGDQEMKNYTIEADVKSDGNRRKMSEVGLINQRYLIVLKGNEQKLEISSNLERLRVPAQEEAPNFRWSPNTWYRLKSRVDVSPDGSGVVRAKAWKKGDPEPDIWTLEVPHQNAHQSGSPGLFGFAPQEMRVYIDNIKVTYNE